jgi:hypothetical protein
MYVIFNVSKSVFIVPAVRTSNPTKTTLVINKADKKIKLSNDSIFLLSVSRLYYFSNFNVEVVCSVM